MIKYSKTHEWANIDGNVAVVGISTFAADELGDVVYFSLPEEGQEIVAGEAFCEVESVKAVSPINAPVSGKIIEVNAELEDAPEKVNEDAMNAWICKVEVSDVPADLMDEAAYGEFIK